MISKLKDLLNKYWWVIVIVFGIIAIMGLFKPAKEIHTKETIVDSTWKKQFSEYQTQMLTTFKQAATEVVNTYKKSMDINKDVNTVLKEVYDPITGKLTSRTLTKIDKTTYDSIVASTTSSTVTINAGSVSTSTITITDNSSGASHQINTITTIKENVGLLGYGVGYGSLGNTIMVGPGINLGPATSVIFGPEYSITKTEIGWFVLGRGSF